MVGEGTLKTLVHAMDGTIEYVSICGPLFEKREAPIGFVGDLAIIECAAACGLELLEEKQKDPYQTTTYGLGQLMKAAMQHGVKKMMICLGGSSTNDGGIGMMSALGVRFLDENNQEVPLTMRGLFHIQKIDVSHIDERLKQIQMIGVCDVDNPLCGKQGATYVYGPQKGVKEAEKKIIDEAMLSYAIINDNLREKCYREEAGAGAAGGLGYALLSFCQATLKSGFEIVSEVLALEEKIKTCDKVFVGEGKIDKQTQFGKTPYGVLKIAKKYHKDVYAFAGKVEDEDILKQLGFQNVYAITQEGIPLPLALSQGQENLASCVSIHMEEIINGI